MSEIDDYFRNLTLLHQQEQMEVKERIVIDEVKILTTERAFKKPKPENDKCKLKKLVKENPKPVDLGFIDFEDLQNGFLIAEDKKLFIKNNSLLVQSLDVDDITELIILFAETI